MHYLMLSVRNLNATCGGKARARFAILVVWYYLHIIVKKNVIYLQIICENIT